MSGPNERDNSKSGRNLENARSNERDEIAAVLAKVIDRRTGRHMGVDSWTEAGRECADAIIASDWLAERDRRTAATAVREAAEEIGEGDGISRFIGMDPLPAAVRAEKRAQAWLRDRARRIEADQ